MASRSITLKEGTVLSLISQAKSAGRTPQDMLSKLSPSVDRKMTASDEIHRIVAEVYAGYEETLTQNNALDFDGLITRGVQLFSEHPSTAEWCEHIFVDELYGLNPCTADTLMTFPDIPVRIPTIYNSSSCAT